MLTAITEQGDVRNLKTTDDGKLIVSIGNGSADIDVEALLVALDDQGNERDLRVDNEGRLKIVEKKPVVISTTIVDAGGTEVISGDIVKLQVANYSESKSATIEVGNDTYVVPENITIELPIIAEEISVTAATDAKLYVVAIGEE